MKNERTQRVKVNISEKQTIIELSELTQKYKSEIFLEKVVRGSVIEVNLKSFLGLITLNLKNGDQIVVRTVGEDNKEAGAEVESFLTQGD